VCSKECCEEIEVDSYEQGQTLAKIHTFSESHDKEDVKVYYITTTKQEILFMEDCYMYPVLVP
jgi:hypothetical protein